ncbi:MAG: hypothetical protein AAGA70_13640 [Pseudomonadota bacterium]
MTVQQVEATAHKSILKPPADQPIILPAFLTTKSARERLEWNKFVESGQARPPFWWCMLGVTWTKTSASFHRKNATPSASRATLKWREEINLQPSRLLV